MLTPEDKATLARILHVATNGSERALEDTLFEIITNEHRTLQQAWFRVTKNVISRYGDLDASYFDARNEASRAWCRRVTGDDDGRPNFVALPTI